MSQSLTSDPSNSTNPAKATFTILEGDNADKVFTVQYNPKEFKVDKKVSWKEVEEQGQDKAPLEFQKGSPRAISMELMFDTTYDGAESSVYLEWVQQLLAMTNVDATPGGGESAGQGKKRPTSVKFLWSDFELIGVIESITTSYTMFASDGTPLRAKCQVKMKEWDPEAFDFDDATGGQAFIFGEDIAAASGNYSASNTTSRPTVATTQKGQTPSELANKYGTSTQQICVDNDIDDPFYEFQGEDIIVRPNSGPVPPADDSDDFDWMGLIEDAVDAAQSDDPGGNLADLGQENASPIADELDLF